MYRSHWELDALVRHRSAEIATECQRYTQYNLCESEPANPLTHLRHSLGISLIQLGQALAGHDAVRGLPAPPSRPATWGQPSF